MNLCPFLRGASIGLIIPTLFAASASFGDTTMTSSGKNPCFVYFGTYTGTKSQGIYVSRFDPVTGKLGAPELAAGTKNPSFVAIHPNHRFLYAVGEFSTGDGKKGGVVSAFAIDPASGKLALLNQQPAGAGGAPCHVNVDKAGEHVMAANYGGGSVVVLALNPDGSLGKTTAFVQHTGSSVNPKRQAGPHAHQISLDAANRFVFVPDLGLDKVMIYRYGPKGALTPNDPAFATIAPGAGPRHIAFHPNGRFAYVINEIACTMTVFSYDAKRGELKELQYLSTLPDGVSVQPNYSTAEGWCIHRGNSSMAPTAATTPSPFSPWTRRAASSRSSGTNPPRAKSPAASASTRRARICWRRTRTHTTSLSSALMGRPAG